MVPIPGTDRSEELVLNEAVEATVEAAEAAIQTDDWRLGYALTVHSLQGITIHEPQKVWVIDDYFQWFSLAYLDGVHAPARTGDVPAGGGFRRGKTPNRAAPPQGHRRYRKKIWVYRQTPRTPW